MHVNDLLLNLLILRFYGRMEVERLNENKQVKEKMKRQS